MKIQVVSDLHLEFENFNIHTNNADIVVLAGDIHVNNKGVLWALEHIKNKPVIYVLGNHEYYGKSYPKLVNKLKELTSDTNIRILENDTFTYNGINFMGCTLWTDFELFGDPQIAGFQCQQVLSDYRKIRRSPEYSKLRSIDVSTIHRQSISWLKQQLEMHKTETNIVITHHGPSKKSLADENTDDIIKAGYVSNLDSVLNEYQPALWLHGHLHNSSDYTIGNCRVICNPRGYPDHRNPDFNENLLLEIANQA